ncbi:TPR-like protein [Phellopilus nigrolimitatus]|nr:TPR-like protein [Phellopilus nigrolimitatus]
MALPMLVNGADCGPVNPLQGLSKRFDQDRGIQQDQFGTGRAGSSREAFRTAQPTNPALEQEAARFFSRNNSQGGLASPTSPAPNAFDLSLLRNSLPVTQSHAPPATAPSPMQMQVPQVKQHHAPAASWASDFLLQTRSAGPSNTMTEKPATLPQTDMAVSRPMNQALSPGPSGLGMQWAPSPMSMMTSPQFAPPSMASPPLAQSPVAAALWDKEFQSHEAFFHNPSAQLSSTLEQQQQQPLDPAQTRRDADDLARTADEQNPKFKNSRFMALMRELRDGEIVVDGSDMVARDEARDVIGVGVDVKGKGREHSLDLQSAGSVVIDPSTSTDTLRRKSVHFDQRPETLQEESGTALQEEDPVEAYFRRENDEYIDYWNTASSSTAQQRMDADAYLTGMNGIGMNAQEKEWGALQESWDSYEATTWGVKPVAHYQFQPHNPYLLGGENTRAMNQQHAMHSGRSLYESVLELEAEVQRNPTSVSAWYDLGVKQQENEREAKAILALKRALDLDSTHLPSWLALAISHTNEGDRLAADETVEQWVRRNAKYERVVTDFFERTEKLNGATLDSLNQARKHDELIHCLMAMARHGSTNGDVDADVQIALAVLLNTSEEYLKAQDCFKAALSVRPDDWQLYNRVGATLANSGLSEDAFQYYYRALELNPAYIRARFNLGISCMNMRVRSDPHPLDALIMQDSDRSVSMEPGSGAESSAQDTRGITSSTLWDSLRTSCLHLQRIDLATLCDRKDIEGFRREFHV